MNTLTQTFQAPPANIIKPSVRKDLLVVGVVTAATYLLSGLFELNERLATWTVPHEAYQLDELPVTILAMSVALAWFSWRRSRQAMEQVTLRLAAQQALVDSEEQYRTLFMENLSGNLLATTSGRVKLANPAAAQLFGFETAEDLIDRELGELYADRKLWESHRERLLRGEKIEMPMLELKNREGVPVQVVAKLGARLSPSREPELRIYVTDISEVTLMQNELAGALEENRRLSQRSMQVQEEERRNLARELHDELGQSLNAIKVDAVTIRDRSAALPEIHRSALSIIEVSSQVYDVVRSLMQRLRPVALDELGLRSAVQYSVEQWQRRHAGVRSTFTVEGELDDLDEQTNITLYRLVQECLTNVAKHAEATQVAVSMTRAAQDVRFSFSDNGKGFDPSQKRRGLGLVGLRERVEALAGHFELESAPGRGVHVKALIPAKGHK
ncbi:MAG TPA: ATP-binding protein [Burkholderiales bacterium]|jgi:PAS domain S-box-containing protein|nr:ATP-binding protein [Burkholderiales bacterium]